MPWIVPLGISGWGFQGRLRRLEPAPSQTELTGKTEEGPTKELF